MSAFSGKRYYVVVALHCSLDADTIGEVEFSSRLAAHAILFPTFEDAKAAYEQLESLTE